MDVTFDMQSKPDESAGLGPSDFQLVIDRMHAIDAADDLLSHQFVVIRTNASLQHDSAFLGLKPQVGTA